MSWGKQVSYSVEIQTVMTGPLVDLREGTFQRGKRKSILSRTRTDELSEEHIASFSPEQGGESESVVNDHTIGDLNTRRSPSLGPC